MQLSRTRPVVSATFDEPNLVSSAGLVPLMALARKAGLRELADERMSVPTDKGANAGLKLSSLVAGMAAGADSIDDMALLRHGGMGKVFTGAYAPSTLGSFALVHLRARPPGRRGRLEIPAQPRGAHRTTRRQAGRGHGDRRPRRHHRRGPRLSKAGRRVRVLRDQGPQCPTRHRLHRSGRAGDRG